jgi:hypothetical protein
MNEPVEMDDWDADEPRYARALDAVRTPAANFWPAWLWPLLVWLPLDAWHTRFVRDLPPVDPEALARAHLPAGSLAWFATALVLVAALAEAGCYGMLWAARGRRQPVFATTVAVVQTGALELAALDLIEAAGRTPGTLAILLAGPRALVPQGAVAGAAMVAFGSVGLLTLGRCAAFAGLQSGLVGCRWRAAFAMVCGTWLVSHVAQWWLLELFVGPSMFQDSVLK